MLPDSAHRLGTLAVVVAHPDDELIGAGGRLLRWAAACRELDEALRCLPSPPSVIRLGVAHEGGHPDHDAVALAVQTVRAETGPGAFRRWRARMAAVLGRDGARLDSRESHGGRAC